MVHFVKPGLILSAFFAVASYATAAIPAPIVQLSMQTGAITSQPIGHYEFCQKYKSECNIRSSGGKAANLTKSGWDLVRSVNAAVNKSITPMTDMDAYGRDEVWSYPTTTGDCEDFALQKRKILMDRGFSASDLLMTVLRKQDGEGHAVLTLRTTEGDFILDNLNDDVKLWSKTSYHFLKRQDSRNSGRWVTIENGAEVLVGSVGN